MTINKINIFSLVQNIKKYLENDKITIFDDVVSKRWFDNQKYFIKNKCDVIYNDIMNHCYTYEDLKIFILYNYLFNEKITWNMLENKLILYSIEQLSKDTFLTNKKFLEDLNVRLNITNLNDYFKINNDGKSMMYELIINKYVSPIFYIKSLKYLTNENIIYDNEHKEHSRFRFIINLLNNELNDMDNSKKKQKK